MNNNPFAALSALRDSLPEGSEQAQNTPNDNATQKSARKTVTLFFERKGRAGKEATIIECDASMSDDDVNALGAELKRALGTGGSVRPPEILLQGDRRAKLHELLTKKGYTVKG
jgi:predicted translation initiation factor SUI1